MKVLGHGNKAVGNMKWTNIAIQADAVKWQVRITTGLESLKLPEKCIYELSVQNK